MSDQQHPEKHSTLQHNQTHIDLELKQLEYERQRLQLEIEFERKQLHSEIELERKQHKLEIDFERKQHKSAMELERKQHHAEMELERKQFEFEKQQYLLLHNNNHHQPQSSPASVDLLSPTISYDNKHDNDINTTSSSNANNNSSDLQSLTPIILQIIQDYDAIKYLLGQPVLDLTKIQSDMTTLSTSIKQLQSNQSSLQSQTQSQIQTIVSKVDQFINHNEFVTTNACINLIKQNSNEIKQIIDENTQNELRSKINDVFEQNRKIPLSYPDLCYQFENLPGIQLSCGYPSADRSLYALFYALIADQYLPHHLNSLKPKIQSSRLYISSPSVLNGQWIQIQGDGAVLDMKTTDLYDFIKDGDNKTPFTPCDPGCIKCQGKTSEASSPTSNRYLIKFKWD